ncbi:MAG: sensor domain-containing diguanylate cyclase [Henriciella sp.]|nr:sensor domain-containing diguanylate cyclase [Henriciella sp.]
MAVGFLGIIALAFLAFASVHELSRQFLLLESAIILVVTLGLLILVARHDKKTEEAEAIAESQLSHLADFATDLYWETDLEGHVIAAGGRLMKTFFPDINHVVGRHYMSVIKLDDTEREKMLNALQAIKPYSDILSVFHATDGRRFYISLSATPRYSKSGAVIGYLGVGTNVTRRIEAQGRLKHMAEHDMLTGLANRYSFQNRIEKDIAESAEDENIAILAIDLDNFKSINDTFGHQTGDALLNLVAARIVSSLSRPFRVGGLELKCSASVGVACAPLHAESTQGLLKCADLALYEAKGSGRSCYRLFQTPETRRAAVN